MKSVEVIFVRSPQHSLHFLNYQRSIAVLIAQAIGSFDAVIKEGSQTELNPHQSIFNAAKTVFDDADPDIDRRSF